MNNRGRVFQYTSWLAVFIGVAIAPLAAARAQGNPNQFGGQDRADAVSKLIVLGVQQAISSLPPTSGQSFAYHFDPKIGAFSPDELLGPIVFRSTDTLGAGNLNLRFGISYFSLSQTFDPVADSRDKRGN